MRIAVIGGGFTGLTASLKLAKNGLEVILFEKENHLGGLASGFSTSNWEWKPEEHYHHLFTSDKNAINLLKEIGMGKDLFFRRPVTAIYYEKSKIKMQKSHVNSFEFTVRAKSQFKVQNLNIYPFDTPINLLTFPYLSFLEKIRAGIVILFLKLTPFWKPLERVTADEWLSRFMGKHAFEILFEPLFIGKFGNKSREVSMAWFWARIKKRSSSLGYIKGGFQNFADKLGEEIEKNGGKIFISTEILEIKKEGGKIALAYKKDGILKNELFDRVISTIPTKNFLRTVPTISDAYKKQLQRIEHLDSLNLVLVLKKSFLDKVYWLNINDKSFPFLALVDHGNFIGTKNYGGNHIVYIGNYLPSDHPFFKKIKEELLEIFDPYLIKINPLYKDQLLDYKLFRGAGGQTIVPVNFSGIKPVFTTPWKDLFLANLDMVYPWDRGINYAIEMGEKVTKIISNS